MTKTELIGRLFKEGHITFEEVLLLAENEKQLQFVPMPYPIQPFQPIQQPAYPSIPPYNPDPYWYQPYRVYC